MLPFFDDVLFVLGPGLDAEKFACSKKSFKNTGPVHDICT